MPPVPLPVWEYGARLDLLHGSASARFYAVQLDPTQSADDVARNLDQVVQAWWVGLLPGAGGIGMRNFCNRTTYVRSTWARRLDLFSEFAYYGGSFAGGFPRSGALFNGVLGDQCSYIINGHVAELRFHRWARRYLAGLDTIVAAGTGTSDLDNTAAIALTHLWNAVNSQLGLLTMQDAHWALRHTIHGVERYAVPIDFWAFRDLRMRTQRRRQGRPPFPGVPLPAP